ncbi:MAG: Crp/Fnr family transcriptional regulator [Bacteroidetes bacterium]|nr:Crp/Fnr family transcriptional regulator [Bacteroidota bacterium]
MQYPNPHIEFCLENPDSIFKGLPIRDKEAVIRNHVTVQVRKGDFIYTEGEKSKGIICLASGKFKIFRIGVGGREQILKLIKPSELTGFRNIFQPLGWNNSSIAIEDSVVCILDRNTISGILKSNTDFSFRMIKLITDELNFTNERIISLTQKHVRGRLVETLLMLGEIYGFEPDGRTINALLSRDDIAHHSNMTTSNAIRTLSNLASGRKNRNKKEENYSSGFTGTGNDQ